MPDATDTLFKLRLDLPRAAGEALGDLLAEEDQELCAWLDEERDACRLEWFCATRAAAERKLNALQPALTARAPRAAWTAAIEPLPRTDWAEAWKKFFHTRRISRRIVIAPSWEPYAARMGDCVLMLDPGMSFGTGLHGTTRACLAFIDRLAPRLSGAAFLDAGCGSGILAIAAAKLGCRPVNAFDCDPAAVADAQANSARNGLADRIVCETGDLAAFDDRQRFAAVAAGWSHSLGVRDDGAIVAWG